MDATLEKEITVTKLKAAALNHRTESVLAVAELVNEYLQLTTIQQKQIEALQAKLKTCEETLKVYEATQTEKSAEPVGGPVSAAPFAGAG